RKNHHCQNRHEKCLHRWQKTFLKKHFKAQIKENENKKKTHYAKPIVNKQVAYHSPKRPKPVFGVVITFAKHSIPSVRQHRLIGLPCKDKAGKGYKAIDAKK